MLDCASSAAHPGPADGRRAQGGTRTRCQGAGSPGVCWPPEPPWVPTRVGATIAAPEPLAAPGGDARPARVPGSVGRCRRSCFPRLHLPRYPQGPPRLTSSGEVPAGAHLPWPGWWPVPGWSSALQGRHQRGGTVRVTVTAGRWAGAPHRTPRGCTAPCTAGPTVGVPFTVPPEAVAARGGLGWAQPLIFFRKTKAFLEIKLETRQLVAGSDLFGAVEGCHACAGVLHPPRPACVQ